MPNYSVQIQMPSGNMHYATYSASTAEAAVAAAWADWPNATTIYTRDTGVSIPTIRNLFNRRKKDKEK